MSDSVGESSVYQWSNLLEFDRLSTLLVTESEAAQLLRMSTRHLRRLRQQAKVPFFQEGRLIRYPVEGLRAYVRHQTQWGSLVEITPSLYQRKREF